VFQLIIAIIAIALVAVLAVASLYYGGTAFSTGSARAAASTAVSQAQQISAADVLYQNDNAGKYAASVTDLVSGTYLQSEPKLPNNIGGAAWSLDPTSGMVFTTIANSEVCLQINKQNGTDTTPTAASLDGAGLLAAMATASNQYGCFADSAGTAFAVAYK
jgi:hypothetical protein